MNDEEVRLAKAVSIIVGTVVGAGVLGLPYVVSKTGFMAGALLIAAVYAMMLALGIMIEELSLRHPGHQLVDIARECLGVAGEAAVFLFLVASIMAALAAYYVGFARIVAQLYGGVPLLGAYILLAILVVVAVRGLSVADEAELIVTLVMLALIAAIIALLAPRVDVSALMNARWTGITGVFGVAVFALYGHMVIPEVVEEVGRRKWMASKAVALGIAIPAAMYVAFTAVMIGVFKKPPQVATIALQQVSPILGALGLGFAALAILSSAIGNALALRDIVVEDLRKSPLLAVIGVVAPLLIIYTTAGFADILSIAGTYGVGGVCAIMCFSYARRGGSKKLRVVAVVLAVIFIIAAMAELMA